MEKTNLSSFLKRILVNPVFLFWLLIGVNMVPSIYFFFSEPLNLWGKLVILLFGFGLYTAFFTLVKNIGKWQIILFPLFFFHSFQIVLFYLFGENVIAVNMLLNVVTTNPTEAGELLGALIPAIITVVLLYVPPLILSILNWKNKLRLSVDFRKQGLKMALGTLAIAILCSFFAQDRNTQRFSFHENIYPVNLIYNLGFAGQKFYKIRKYPKASENFRFEAHREQASDQRQIIVLVIGETSRADNWSLFGYHRPTNPLLTQQKNLIGFKDALTQSNVTHESVPIILAPIGAENYRKLYKQKGVFEAFREAGFTTIGLSNQAENSGFIEFLMKQADIYENLKATKNRTDIVPNIHDGELTDLLAQKIEENEGDLFIVLHSYGSHFNYKDRYPDHFRYFKPDQVASVSATEKEKMLNAYDNSIRYTDYFLSKTISILEDTQAASFLMYSADHGEDIFDDSRGKFLHSSPTPTYYQLRIAFLSWFSEEFKTEFPKKVSALQSNKDKPVSTNAIFHSLLEAGSISTPYWKKNLSLLNPSFRNRERLFLSDHEKAVPIRQLNLKSQDYQMMKKNAIKF